jgi:hypothetical protein
MTALYRAGRQAEALRTFQELRRYLGDELGIEPSEALRTLEGAILRQAAELAYAPPPAGVAASAPAAPEGLPLPVPLARQDAVFVRPEAEMGRLEVAWKAAQAGRRQLVLLAGEPGIGKTRLSAEIGRVAHGDGAAVLYGRCEDGMGVPYQPFVEALGTYLRQGPAPVLGRLAGELTRLVPELNERCPDLPAPLSADPDTERYRLFDAVAAWLAALAAGTPAVLVLEDLHWATPPTLAMLAHLVRSGEPGRLLIVVNYRDTGLDVTPHLTDTVRRPPPARRRTAPPQGSGPGRRGRQRGEAGAPRARCRRRGLRRPAPCRDGRQPVLHQPGPAAPDRDGRGVTSGREVVGGGRTGAGRGARQRARRHRPAPGTTARRDR